MIVRKDRQIDGKRRGATLVEFALVVPIFFLFFFGLVDIGRGFMVQALLQNAARQGCRVGSLQGKTNSDVTTTVDNALTNSGVTGYTTTVTPNNLASANAGDQVTVAVSVPVANITWAGFFLTSGTLRSTYVLLHE